MTITTQYRKARAEKPTMRAVDALRLARYNAKLHGVETPSFVGDDVRIDLPRGEYIVCKLVDDSDADIRERLNVSWDDHGVPEDGRTVGWMDRDGRVLFDTNPNGYGYEWAMWTADTTGWTLADRIAQNRKAGMSRHAAWIEARASIAREFDYFREVMRAGYVGYVVTLFDADGEEVDEESCYGFEAVDDYAGQEARSIAGHMAEQRAKYWTAEVERQRDKARDIRDTVRQFLGELRDTGAWGGGDTPVLDAAIADKVRELRARHSACMRIVAGGAA